MRIIVPALACLFVFLAGFNVWNMLTSRGSSARSSRLWIQVHRAAGYAFIALFAVLIYFMLLRIKGWPDELSPRLVAHMGLALLLVPLLLVKAIVARYQKTARGLLTALGISIFAIAFTLVALNLSIHFLRVASAQKVPVRTSATFVVAALTAAAIAFSARPSSTRLQLSPVSAAPARPSGHEQNMRGDALNLVLVRIEPQAPDARTLRFVLPRGRRLAARPGQFLTFEWMIDGKPVTRSYSICSSPANASFIEITPKRVENGYVSHFLNDRATIGLTVKARGPYGLFCFDESKHKQIVLIAGGSGITPMMAMLRYIDDLCIPVDATLIYCVRARDDVFFKAELAALQARLSNFRCVLVLSRPDPDWTGWTGHLRREILEREVVQPLQSTFFLCGPPTFMQAGRSLLKDLSVDPAQILQESFGGAVAREQSSTASDGPVEVRFSGSGVAYRMSPEETLLEGSERNGVLIPYGCRQGICGTCATKLLSGNVHMERDQALTDELRLQGFILPCVSRALSDITLEA